MTLRSLAAKDERWQLDLLSRWYKLRKLGRLQTITLSNYGGGLKVWDQESLEWQAYSYEELEHEVWISETTIRREPGREESGAREASKDRTA